MYLFKKLVTEDLADPHQILAYADDILIVTNTQAKVKGILSVIDQWSVINGMKLNKKKSAIVEFIPRHAKKTNFESNELEGVPIVNKYKYFGLWMNQRLTLDDQYLHIKKKSDFLRAKLYPMLTQSSLNYRENLWSMLMRPLFEFTLAIYEIEPAETRKLQFQRLLKRTFKDFTLLSKTTPDRTILAFCCSELD